MKNVLKMTAALAAAMAMAACAGNGTLIGFETQKTTVTRAVDQAILGDAIDGAFANLKLDAMKGALKKFKHRPRASAPPRAPVPAPVAAPDSLAGTPAPPPPAAVPTPRRKTMSAYIEVVSPLAIAAETTAYIHQRASVVAAQIGLRIVEVNERRYQPSSLRPSEVVEKIYPDTDARVVVMVSHAGVDEHNTIELQTAHGDTKPDRILKGRFKATIAITPRQADFTTVVGKLAGASSYEIKNGKYIDVR